MIERRGQGSLFAVLFSCSPHHRPGSTRTKQGLQNLVPSPLAQLQEPALWPGALGELLRPSATRARDRFDEDGTAGPSRTGWQPF